MNQNNVIEANAVVKIFRDSGEERCVLNQVSIRIAEGEFIAVMGPSGSGKTTLLFCLSGMDQIDSGTVLFDGALLSALTEDERAAIRAKKMGFVFQQPSLLKHLNILDNIMLTILRERHLTHLQIRDKAERLMNRTGIAELKERDIKKVSGGQLQRAGICRALMNDPKVLFLDEPTGSLNSQSAKEVLSIFTDINKEGCALMLVTHDPAAAAVSERVLFMKDGNFIDELNLGKYPNDLKGRSEKVLRAMQLTGV
jgi:putative ABC transport system ATP-binding protein